jgi:SAM-dependent methyltransferase
MADELKISFDAYYYAHCCGRPYDRSSEWFQFFGGIANRIVSDLCPHTVLDAGCAIGLLVEELRKREVEAFGLDISDYAIGEVHESVKPYCWVGSVTDPFPQRYDLIVSMEVLEHMPKNLAEVALENMCRHTDQVLFSSSPFDYKEATHYNVQPPEYWAEQFARHGFFRDVDFDAYFVTPWAVLFRRNSTPSHLMIKDYERKFWLLWKENTDLRSLVQDMRNENNGLIDQANHLREHNANMSQQINNLVAKDAQRVQELQALQAEVMNLRGSRIVQMALKARNLKRLISR